MAALVQGYPQQSGTVTMLQTRPSSASGMLQTIPTQPASQHRPAGSQRQNGIHALPSSASTPAIHRGPGPIQPYAFTTTPTALNPPTQWQQVRAHRTGSSPAVPNIQALDLSRSRYAASSSMTNLPSTVNISLHTNIGSRDDSTIPARPATSPRPANPNTATQSSTPSATPPRPLPERYRRSALRPDPSVLSPATSPVAATTSGNVNDAPSLTLPDPNSLSLLRPSPPPGKNRPNSCVASARSPVDDFSVPRGQTQEEIKKIRRRSLPALDSVHLMPYDFAQSGESRRPQTADNNDNRASYAASRLIADLNGYAMELAHSDVRASRQSGESTQPSSASRNASPVPTTNNPTPTSSLPHQQTASHGAHSPVNIPPRSSSTDAASAKKTGNPSPLSKPVTMDEATAGTNAADASNSTPHTAPSPSRIESLAVRKLTDISEKSGKPRSKTSRLRRAFSFGSAAEFRKAAQGADEESKSHKARKQDGTEDEEQDRIAQQQEAAGIGSNIYGGRFFSGSTDNLSISSTASSASIMIRKMGRGMKKGTRSLVGLFRPKSLIGDKAGEAKQKDLPQTAVSMVTAEAEVERAIVHPETQQLRGALDFSRTGSSSGDTNKSPGAPDSYRPASSEVDNSFATPEPPARKTIVGDAKDRAEVLASVTPVRKGILKNRNGSSSSPRPSETKPSDSDSSSSSAPSTPSEDQQGAKRAQTIAVGNEDYFVSALRLRQEKGNTTPGQQPKRCTTFSPRIVFFETWPSQEYDRRGDIATCNRLTPMLAQQIKEELNNFKMQEMEVHESSKIYTHFF